MVASVNDIFTDAEVSLLASQQNRDEMVWAQRHLIDTRDALIRLQEVVLKLSERVTKIERRS